MDPPFPLDDFSSSNSRNYYSETTPLQRDKIRDSSFNVISGCFAVLTAIISVALGIHLYSGNQQVTPHGALVSDSSECTRLGQEVLEERGNAVDASVAITLCLSVVKPHLNSIGGSGVMLIYDHRIGNVVDCLDFRPGKTSLYPNIGVPGLLKGLYVAHENYGNMKWKHIVKRVAALARNGFVVSESLFLSRANIKASSRVSNLDQWMHQLNLGNISRNLPLASALGIIAERGAVEFYNGEISKDLRDYFSERDLKDYTIGRGGCQEKSREGYKFFTTGNYSGGPRLIDALSWVKFEPNATPLASLLNLRDVVHVDEPYHAGVAVNVMDHQDLYVSVISGLGEVLGSQILTSRGFILNSSPINSSRRESYSVPFTPLVAVQKDVCGERLVLGSTDYRDVLQLIMFKLASQVDLQTAVENPRVRLKSNLIELEEVHAPSFSLEDKEQLIDQGNRLSSATLPYPSLNVVQRINDTFFAYADSRGQGLALTL